MFLSINMLFKCLTDNKYEGINQQNPEDKSNNDRSDFALISMQWLLKVTFSFYSTLDVPLKCDYLNFKMNYLHPVVKRNENKTDCGCTNIYS